MDTPATPSTSGPPQNAFQRRYFAWAAPYYARMAPTLRHEVECLDRWLYSRAGLKLWLMLSGAIALTTIALVATGTRWSLALPATATGAVAILLVSLGAWLQPERYTSRKVLRFFGSALVLACLSALCPVIVIHVSEGGTFDAAYVAHLRDLFVHKAMPLLLLLVVVVLVVAWSVAAIRRFQMQRELVGVRLVQERDAVARQLAEARLQLLQGQIQPHFIFNTLAAVQHWVDSADPRAGPLLRALSSFLRGSTELLTQERTTFGVEVEVVRHYLAIMEARLGDRLRHAVAIDHGAASQPLPPGVLLTLVENAIEHGISPALHGGTIAIAAADDGRSWTLRVRDDGVGVADGWVEGIGLRNCRERLQAMFGPNASLSLQGLDGTTVATIRIARAATP